MEVVGRYYPYSGNIINILKDCQSIEEVEEVLKDCEELQLGVMIYCSYNFLNQQFSEKFFRDKTKNVNWESALKARPISSMNITTFIIITRVIPDSVLIEWQMKGWIE